ncbi:MAG: MBL fold metallo-hydrolase [Lentisphaeria bacterium]|nr:MBL fold metallo-hydrolase [Lentisphaeria bacterium]
MPKSLKITMLSDNLALPGYEGEHGFALHLELQGKQILLDAGCDENLMLRNAQRAGLDLKQLDYLIVSHGHYDHVGALAALLKLAPKLQVLAHPNILKKRYSIRNGEPKDIAIPESPRLALENHRNTKFFRGALSLCEQVRLFNEIPRISGFEDTGGPFFCDTNGEIADPIEDETLLCIRRQRELFIFSGCSHSGIVNILWHLQKQYPDCVFKLVLGGLHLVNASQQRLQATLRELDKLPLQNLVACHCSGEVAMRKIAENMPAKSQFGAAGKQWEC